MNTRIDWQSRLALSICVIPALAGCSVLQNSTSAADPNNSPNIPISGKEIAIAEQISTTAIAEGLEHPWGMTWLPDGNILVTERPGRLRIIREGKLEPQAIAGVPEVFSVTHGGLLDISLHPDYAENNLVYFTFADGDRSANRTKVARAVFDGTALTNWTEIFEVNLAKPGGQHFGSRMIWLPDKTMLVAFGDGGNPPLSINGELIRQQAQNLNSHLGSVVRINDDGSIPEGNPFEDRADANPAIWSYGHRNIQGMAIDPTTEQVWSTEHGSKGGDELNLMQAGQNYGWPEVSYSDEYSGGRVAQVNSRSDVPEPKVIWTPSIAPSGLAVYYSDRYPQWQGDLFAGGLVSRDVRRIDLDSEGNVLREESIPIGQRVRDVRQSPDGRLFVLTDEQNGQLIEIELKDG